MKTKAKPFLKFAGGKNGLLPVLDQYLPPLFQDGRPKITYIEPFVGGGAMLFFLLQNYPNIKKAVINDLNTHLITTYKVVRDNPSSLIEQLKSLEDLFFSSHDKESQKELFLKCRERFNQKGLSDVEEASLMIFLNHTCFNGLYRENRKGEFNVPFGKYSNPTILNKDIIISDSELLQKVEILNVDYSETEKYINGCTFFYLDPPYRPIGKTSSFNSYVKNPFDDNEQIRLKEFFTKISEDCLAMLSNSDCKDGFFDDLYHDFFIERVRANRNINSKSDKRGSITELLIRNYRVII